MKKRVRKRTHHGSLTFTILPGAGVWRLLLFKLFLGIVQGDESGRSKEANH
jgi:hypothetical protein